MKAITTIFKRYSGKKFFIFLASIAILFYFWNEARMDPKISEELTTTLLWTVAVVSAAASLGQGIHEHGSKKEE